MEQGETVKHYRLLERLGEGGMGVVWRAEDTRLGRTVALKRLHRDLADDVERVRRFEREARIVSSLSHPGIATLYDFDHDQDGAFLAMEFVEGPTLRRVLEDGPMPLRDLADCAAQVADALAAAHAKGIVHRDLKPENVMRTATGHYKVLDFGVAHREPRDSDGVRPTRTPTVSMDTIQGALIGTLAYMSPEQVMGRPVDARSDLFSFGALLYELATASPPFRGANEIALAHAVAYETPAPARASRPELPAALDRVIARCLAKRPEDRYATARELADDLRALQLETVSGRRMSDVLSAIAIGRSPRRWPWVAAAAVAVAAAALAVGLAMRPKPTAGRGVAPAAVAPSSAVLPAATPGRPRVVVAPFRNNVAGAEDAWLAGGLSEMLTTDLSRSPGLEVIATQRLEDLAALSGRGPDGALDRATTTELARWAGADVVVVGSVFRAGGRYRIDAQGYDTRTGAVRIARKVEGTELFAMVDELTEGLLRGLAAGAGELPGRDVATTASQEAFRRYSRAATLYAAVRYADAAAELRAALDLDPGFALARERLGLALAAEGRTDEAAAAFDAALATPNRMPDRDRRLAEALRDLYGRHDVDGAIAKLEDLVRSWPDATDAYVWWARALGRFKEDRLGATRQLRRAIDRDPNFLPALAELASQLAEIGESAGARSILEDAARRNPGARQDLARLLRRYASGS